jgi:hypothetical protein
MNQKTSGQDPQNTRNAPAIYEWEGGDWTYPAGGPVMPTWEDAQVIPAEPKNYPASTSGKREVAPFTEESPQPFVWKRKDTMTVVRFVVPVAAIVTTGYGVFLVLAWLVTQTFFWLSVGAIVLFVSLFSDFPRRDKRDKHGMPVVPEKRTGGNVTTNVFVRGNAGDVTTNVFVNYQNDDK